MSMEKQVENNYLHKRIKFGTMSLVGYKHVCKVLYQTTLTGYQMEIGFYLVWSQLRAGGWGQKRKRDAVTMVPA